MQVAGADGETAGMVHSAGSEYPISSPSRPVAIVRGMVRPEQIQVAGMPARRLLENG